MNKNKEITNMDILFYLVYLLYFYYHYYFQGLDSELDVRFATMWLLLILLGLVLV